MIAMNPFERRAPADAGRAHPRSVELYNDATHDSTVDTDGKNREAARIASGGPISPDQITTSNASLVNAMPETPDGFAGFDSRPAGNHPQFALRSGYTVVDKGFDAAASHDARAADEFALPYHPPRRPGRIVEFAPIPR
ncbi:hypothetical protein WS86_30725 [Burkholderia savannae]|uniref:DUF3005 domain-containing protein n=1 Tax=Burkholderia savannae TaxID=1637837 RepID=UPI0007556421|nr:DUF3005 domain-containing protein [Burkholderia savannae]AOJ84861.1 hypothetical protein WS86_30725 [Burkholderia savannae]